MDTVVCSRAIVRAHLPPRYQLASPRPSRQFPDLLCRRWAPTALVRGEVMYAQLSSLMISTSPRVSFNPLTRCPSLQHRDSGQLLFKLDLSPTHIQCIHHDKHWSYRSTMVMDSAISQTHT